MSSLQGAPSLGGSAKKPFTFDVNWDDDAHRDEYDDDDDNIPEVGETKDKHSKKKSSSKKDKEKKSSRKSKKSPEVEKPPAAIKTAASSKPKREPEPEPAPEEEEYEDDFDEDALDSDDYIPPVMSTPPPAPVRQSPPKPHESPRSTDSGHGKSTSDEEGYIPVAEVEERLRAERVMHERRMREFEEVQAEKEREQRRRQAELQREIESLKSQQPSADEVKDQVERLVAARLAEAMRANPQSTSSTAATTRAGADNSGCEDGQDRGAVEQQQRRRQRERERALQLRRLHEEEAARSLFQRLAQDVREVFHELNLSVVAAEKERLIKDERYRREREAKDRREEMERAEKLQKEARERAEREEKFWAASEEREEKMRSYIEDRMRRDDEEREARLKRDLEDRAGRAQGERCLREQLEQLEREHRAKQEAEARERDSVVLESQLAAVRAQYERQVEEVRRQNDLAREHSEELHRIEVQLMEKRYDAAMEKLLRQHGHEVNAMETYTTNAARLQKLIEGMHAEMEATKAMNEKLTQERVGGLKEREKALEEQRATLAAMLEDLRDAKADLDKERTRVVGLYTKFELSLSTFVKNAEEDRRRLQEAQAHFDTLRQQAEKDRRLMLSEVAQERKVLEQQQEELLARKIESLNEIQAERLALSRERTEAAAARERQNRDETELLTSLREREREYTSRLEATDADRAAVTAMKVEQQQLVERAAAERDALRRERDAFEREKEELLSRFEEVRRRAEEAAASQDRARRELVEERAAREFGIMPCTAAAGAASGGGGAFAHADPMNPLPASAASRLQMGLAQQRAVLQRLAA